MQSEGDVRTSQDKRQTRDSNLHLDFLYLLLSSQEKIPVQWLLVSDGSYLMSS